MSRDLTTDFKTAVSSSHIRPFLLFQAFFDSATLRFWNGTEDLVHDGDTYTGAGHLLGLSSIDETVKVESRGIILKLSGIPASLISVALSEDYQERKVTIDLGFFDDTGAIIADPFRFFSGKADVMGIQYSGQTATISLSAENDLIVLQRSNERRRTKEDQRLQNGVDTFCDDVAALQSKTLVWGG